MYKFSDPEIRTFSPVWGPTSPKMLGIFHSFALGSLSHHDLTSPRNEMQSDNDDDDKERIEIKKEMNRCLNDTK